MKRRTFITKTSLATAGILSLGKNVFTMPDKADILIKNAQILDGTGVQIWQADLLIQNDRIRDIGHFNSTTAKKTIDASGLYLSPGFIDIHTHSDDDILLYPGAESRITQGITTEVTGNCGYSATPLKGMDREKRAKSFKDDGIEESWTDVDSYCKIIDEKGIALNQALLLGQGTLRRNAIGLVDRHLTKDELKSVLYELEKGMDQGAFGFSTGLEYTPGAFTPTEELIELAKVTARLNGLYATHMRDEEQRLLSAISEALTISRKSGVRLQISHLKANGKANWDKQIAALNMIELARAKGVDVMFDAYPYNASSTTLTVFLPHWSREGGSKQLGQRLADPATREKISKETDHKVMFDLGGYELIVINSLKNNQNLIGKNIIEIAELWNAEPIEAVLRLLEKENFSVGFVGHGMNPQNVEKILAHPLAMIGSDGDSQAPYGPAAKDRPHPRSYGTCTRVLGYYCREQKIFDLPTAIKKMTSMPADQLGLTDRGRIAKGNIADLVLFDFDEVKDLATFNDPHQYSTGIEYVFVNGTAVIQKGEMTNAKPGKMLRS
ncbi:MAG: D-aminoacylase [Calditrichaeota bacterium]|nr:MAG: D-aminoacylase [Calditrichota bacterium]MBL1206456.1 D-aminoacylase [Calditrichota bacterium]NOG46283.1 D-aminoacylase [Calditrichota bacterium]